MNPNLTDHDPIPFDYTAVMDRITRSQPTITFAELMHHIFPPGVDRPYILKLPHDVLGRVVSFVDTNDLTALRLTCKKLEKAVTSKFIDHFIKCRRHVLSLYSLHSLVHLVTHPVFGQLIEAIIIDTTYTLEYAETTSSITSTRGLYDDFYQVLKEIFDHLSVHGNLTKLGVTDRNPASFGIQALLSRPTARRLKQERGHILLKLRECAKDAGLTVGQLDIDSAQHLGPDFMGSDLHAFASTVLDVAEGLSPSRSLRFKVSMMKLDEFRLIWDHKHRSLEVTGLTEWLLNGSENILFGLFSDMTPVSAASIRHLTLSNCHARMDYDYLKLMELLRICSRTLEKVKLSGIAIRNDSKWSPVFRLLARAPHLTKFEITALSRQVHTLVDSNCRSAMIVHTDQALGDGDKVSTELDDLATMVEADEITWESLDDRDPEKWTYRMTSLKKTSKTVDHGQQAIKKHWKRLLPWGKERANNKHAHIGWDSNHA